MCDHHQPDCRTSGFSRKDLRTQSALGRYVGDSDIRLCSNAYAFTVTICFNFLCRFNLHPCVCVCVYVVRIVHQGKEMISFTITIRFIFAQFSVLLRCATASTFHPLTLTLSLLPLVRSQIQFEFMQKCFCLIQQ